MATGRELLTLRGHTSTVYCAAFSPDGMRLATGGIDRTIKVWDLATGQELLNLRGHGERILSLIFRLDGRQIASTSHDGTVKVWDAAGGQELRGCRVPIRDDSTLRIIGGCTGSFDEVARV